MTKRLSSLVMFLIAVPLVLGCSTRAYGAETFIAETEFETTNKQEDGFAYFPATQEIDGKSYTLTTVITEVIKEESIQKDIITFEGESFTGDPENHNPQESVEQDGKVYKLRDYEYFETKVEERTKDVSTVVPYEGVEYIDTLPDTGEIEVEDENTQQKVMAKLPYQNHTASEAYWTDFSVPLTVVSYDAEAYTLGDVEIPKDADLSLYGRDLLAYLGLPEAYYRVLAIEWDGDAYESNGELRRNAVATGQKLVKDMEVTYAGQVTFAGIDAHAFSSVYEEVLGDGETLYTMKAAATYKQELADSEETDPWWENLWDWIKDHPVLATLCLALLLLLLWFIIFLFLLAKKRKEEEKATEIIMYDEDDEDDSV